MKTVYAIKNRGMNFYSVASDGPVSQKERMFLSFEDDTKVISSTY